MGSRPTIFAGMTRGLADWAEARGLPSAELVARAGIDEAQLRAPEGRIPRDRDSALWLEIERELGDSSFGLELASVVAASRGLGVVGLRAMTSKTLREAIWSSVRHHRLLKDDAEVRLVQVEGSLVIDHTCPPDQAAWSRPMADFTLATYVACARRWTGQPLKPRLVLFRHAAPRDVTPYERAFGCMVRFGEATNALILEEDALETELATSQPEVASYLESIAATELRALPEDDLVATVRTALREGAARGEVALPRIARGLGTSARTLQRRLAESGVAYQELVDEARRSLAFPLVTLTDLPVDAVSDRLGYSESKAFRRAFRRWMGVGPAEARRLYGASTRRRAG